MKRLIIGIAFVLVACDEGNVVTEVTQSFKVVDKKGHEITIKPGSYDMLFSQDYRKKELKIVFKKANDKGKDISLKLPIPANFEIPYETGTFKILGEQIGQAWDIEGQVVTKYDSGWRNRTTESCSIETTVHRCKEVCTTLGECETVCGDEVVSTPGTREVECQDTTTTRDMKVQFKDTSNEFASFKTNSISVDRQYFYEGSCN